MSVITAAELRFGAEKAARPKLADLSRLTWIDLRFSTGATKLHTTTHGFARSCSVTVSRSGIWTFSSPRMRFPTE